MAKEAKEKATKPNDKQGDLLKRRVDAPIKGKLGKTVRTPSWLRSFGGYFTGAWHELREVRWPTRRATWVLTLAVIVFTALLTGFILGLDYGFEQLFKRILL